ncbi:MarR family transcriptional regulator [Kiloniella litopenaei]|uniref:MarR family transcriptional regulator n=1 Tax=Kiloniella litopenaei TaxID=1549748 RepID=A0A0M2RBB9_9PROT|nr:MarR family transcriptional regulator [Kiloniella litopenaei]KKJ77699.1 MarR family transcriptional regulator [Kiloniella litopenaei]
MTDIKSGPNPLFLRTDEIMQAIELLFFAYRDFTGEPDELLAEYGFGRAHHRVIHFVGRHPGMTVSDLLSILQITKQSLSRVLSQLVTEGFIKQTPGEVDRRQRLLELTEKGAELDEKLFNVQRQRIVKAYKESGAEAVAGFRSVLMNMMDENDRTRFTQKNTLPTPRR